MAARVYARSVCHGLRPRLRTDRPERPGAGWREERVARRAVQGAQAQGHRRHRRVRDNRRRLPSAAAGGTTAGAVANDLHSSRRRESRRARTRRSRRAGRRARDPAAAGSARGDPRRLRPSVGSRRPRTGAGGSFIGHRGGPARGIVRGRRRNLPERPRAGRAAPRRARLFLVALHRSRDQLPGPAWIRPAQGGDLGGRDADGALGQGQLGRDLHARYRVRFPRTSSRCPARTGWASSSSRGW